MRNYDIEKHGKYGVPHKVRKNHMGSWGLYAYNFLPDPPQSRGIIDLQARDDIVEQMTRREK